MEKKKAKRIALRKSILAGIFSAVLMTLFDYAEGGSLSWITFLIMFLFWTALAYYSFFTYQKENGFGDKSTK